MFFDAHTHLNSDQLYPQREQHLQQFLDIGGKGLINIGVNPEWNQRAIDIAIQSSQKRGDNISVKATIGIHPGEVSHAAITSEKDIHQAIINLKRLHDTYSDHIVAIGECGMDAHYQGYDTAKGLQQQLFYEQACFARERELPVVIHSRDQFKDTLEVIQEFSDLKIYFHCRGYTPEDVVTLATIFPQLRIGFCGNTTYPKAQQLRDSLLKVHALQTNQSLLGKEENFTKGNREIEKTSSHEIRLLLETDAPYLSPQQKRGTTNVPLHLPLLYDNVAEYLHLKKEILAITIYDNTKQLYGL